MNFSLESDFIHINTYTSIQIYANLLYLTCSPSVRINFMKCKISIFNYNVATVCIWGGARERGEGGKGRGGLHVCECSFLLCIHSVISIVTDFISIVTKTFSRKSTKPIYLAHILQYVEPN